MEENELQQGPDASQEAPVTAETTEEAPIAEPIDETEQTAKADDSE